MDSVLTGTALEINSGCRDMNRKLRIQYDIAGEIECLLADLADTPHNDMINRLWIKVRPRKDFA